jgi:dTDP-4-dehydrorhamnose 3,5-epimerase
LQWNVTASAANVLRGVHVHARHSDYLVVLQGRMSVGVFDIRANSPSYHRGALMTLDADRFAALRVPVGVMHGFYVHEPTVYMYGMDAYYNQADELGCHWADPGLALAWPCADPLLSERDQRAGTLAQAEARLRVVSPVP